MEAIMVEFLETKYTLQGAVVVWHIAGLSRACVAMLMEVSAAFAVAA